MSLVSGIEDGALWYGGRLAGRREGLLADQGVGEGVGTDFRRTVARFAMCLVLARPCVGTLAYRLLEVVGCPEPIHY